MKRCPKCGQEYSDEWLTFCTQDGTPLETLESAAVEPPVTLVSGSMPPSVSPLEQPTMDMPGAPKPAPYNPPAQPAGWAPPPPPAYPKPKQNSMAVSSLLLGIVSVTVGWCCYFGVITGPVAIGLGIYALSLVKKDPSQFSGKGMAIAGIVMGSLYFVFLALIILLYGLSFLAGGFQ